MTLERELARAFLEDHPSDAALALERLAVDRRAAVLRESPAESARAVSQMVPAAATEALARLDAKDAAPVLEALPLDTAILMLRRLPAEVAARLVAGLAADTQELARRALRYPDGTAGALMDPAVLALPDDISVAEARTRLRRESTGLLYYLFVVDRAGRLVGVLDIAELMRARARDALRGAMHERVEHLPAWTPAAAVRTHPGWRIFHAMPVTDDGGRLVGAIRYQQLRRLEQEAEAGGGAGGTSVTVGALGELFHLGMAGFIEGVAAAAAPRPGRGPDRATGGGGGVR
jgi:magnesium transporter